MPDTVFECATPKCGYAIATTGMNAIQLKALRVWKKTCPRCQQMTHWQEKIPLLNGDQIKTLNGGQKDAGNRKIGAKTASQKRRSAGYSGH